MKKALLAVAALSCVGSAALAGPNAGGTLIAALSVGTVYTSDNTGYCGSSTTTDCNTATVRWDGGATGGEPAVINVLAAFPGPSRLAGLTFGIAYTAGVSFLEYGHCGDFELPDGTWPDSGTGTAVTWGSPNTSQIVEIYWLAAYNYSYTDAQSISLIAHPGQGGNFADDDVPSNIDPIEGYGVFGFLQDGLVACPTGDAPGACCFADGSCAVLLAADCEAQGGTFQGEGTNCDGTPCPQPATGACCVGEDCIILTSDECAARGGTYQGDDAPCEADTCIPTPTFDASWGTIKNTYR